MRSHLFRIRALSVIAFTGLAAGPSWAQPETPRAGGPFAGLFGGEQNGLTHSLHLTGSLFGEYDKDLQSANEPFAGADTPFQRSGPVGAVQGGLAYARRSDRAQFFLDGTGDLRKYTAHGGPVEGIYFVDTGWSTNLGSKNVLNATASFEHLPFYEFGPFGNTFGSGVFDPGFGSSASSRIDAAVASAGLSQPNDSVTGSIGFVSNYSQRSSFSVNFVGYGMRFPDDRSNNLRSWTGQAEFSHHLTRALVLHLGYGRTEVLYSSPGRGTPIVDHLFDVGLTYGDVKTFSRRTAVYFNTSTSVLRTGRESHYMLNGEAMLTRGFGRTWSAAVGYVRDTEFVPAFGQPLLSDSVDARVGGLISPRVQWSSTAAYSVGAIGFHHSNDFTAYTGLSQVQVALNRSVGVFGRFSYYRYRLSAGSSALLLPLFARETVAVGLKLFVPIRNEARPTL